MLLFKRSVHCCVGKDVLNRQLNGHKCGLSASLGKGMEILCHGSPNYENEMLN